MSVTTDIAVLKGWPKSPKNAATSAQVATALGLTVFQITARLKGMEGRGFVARDKDTNKWFVTEAGAAERANPSPSVSGESKRMRVVDKVGNHSGAPKDDQVPRVWLASEDWAPSEDALRDAQTRLPDIRAQAEAAKQDPKRNKQLLAALLVELEHCVKVVKAPRKGKWTSRHVHTPTGAQTIYVAPDQREYVMAVGHETADLLIFSKKHQNSVPPARLRLFSTSAAAKAVKKATKAQTQQAEREAAKEQEARNARILKEEREAQERVVRENNQIRRAASVSRAIKTSKRLVPKTNGRPSRPAPTKTQTTSRPHAKGGSQKATSRPVHRTRRGR